MARLGRLRRQKPIFRQGDSELFVTPAIITQTGSVFSFTRIDQNVNVSIIDRTGATFTPSFTIAATPTIITSTGTVFSPIVMIDQSVTTGLIDQTGTVFDPLFGFSYDFDLIEQFGSVFDAEVFHPRAYISWAELQVPGANVQVIPATIGQQGVIFAPEVGHEPPQEASPQLISNTGQVFSVERIVYGGNHQAFGLVRKSHDVETRVLKGDDVVTSVTESMSVTVEVG